MERAKKRRRSTVAVGCRRDVGAGNSAVDALSAGVVVDVRHASAALVDGVCAAAVRARAEIEAWNEASSTRSGGVVIMIRVSGRAEL